MQYDAAGNLTWDGYQSYQYDAVGRQSYASGTNLSQYYDGDSLRIAKTDNGVTTYYLRSSVLGGEVVAEINGSGGWARGYVYLGSELLAIQSGGVHFVHSDPVAKSQRVTDTSGTVESSIEIDPWGGETSRSANFALQPRVFTTYERDNNGSDDAMMRRYDARWNRFSQPDPYSGSYDLGNPQSFNRYSYTQSDPVNFSDPSGMMPQICGADQGWNTSCGVGGAWTWSGYYDGPHFGGPGAINEAAGRHDELVQARLDGILAQHYLNRNNFSAAARLFNQNENIGLYISGVAIWGELAGAFVTGYGEAASQTMSHGPGDAIKKGWEKVGALLQTLRLPDFIVVTVAAGIEENIAVTRDFNLVISFGGTPGSEISLMAGWILQLTKPKPGETKDFLSRWSLNGSLYWNPRSGLGVGLGVGLVEVSGPNFAFLLGIGGGSGIGGTYGASLTDWVTLTDYYLKKVMPR